jgi:copper chaperone NosL
MRLRPFFAALLLVACTAAVSGPQPIAREHPICGNCGKPLSDPRFVAQVVQDDGHQMLFDEPGCLIEWLEAGRAEDFWFRDMNTQVWLHRVGVGFLRDQAPAEYGFGAVPPDTPGAIPYDEAVRIVRARKFAHR